MPALQTLLFPDPRPLVERLGAVFFRQLSERPGVYLMRDAQENILYVGKAKNLRQRLRSYRVANPDRLGRRHLRLLRQVARIELQECEDETSALAKEAELLLSLRPKFNRAGVWPATPRFLVWRSTGRTLELAITETPAAGWQVFGPFGSGVVHLRAALARLLWLAIHPESGAVSLPEGWLHGRFGTVVSLADLPIVEPEGRGVVTVLTKLFEGDTDGFLAWVGERTKDLAQAYDVAMRDADWETAINFIQAKARRTRPFHAAVPALAHNAMDPDSTLPFVEEDWQQP